MNCMDLKRPVTSCTQSGSREMNAGGSLPLQMTGSPALSQAESFSPQLSCLGNILIDTP